MDRNKLKVAAIAVGIIAGVVIIKKAYSAIKKAVADVDEKREEKVQDEENDLN